MSGAALAFESLAYTYPGASQPALRGVDLEIGEGEFCLLAGLSGSGKSTLLRAACGLVPHFHGGSFAGRVLLCGQDTRTEGPARLGALAGALFQDPETQLVMNTVRAELSLALERRGAGAAAVARAIEEVALALAIDYLLERPTQELSGGEKQRVALAATLAPRPRVVLLDEPTSQLDPVAGEELIGLLRRLNEEWGITVVLAEHRLERCLRAADRVVAMREGEIVCDRDPGGFLEWSRGGEPALETPGARLFALAGLDGAPVSVREARRRLRATGISLEEDGLHPGDGPGGGDAKAPAERLKRLVRTVPKNSRVTLVSGAPPALPNACPGQGAPLSVALRMRGVWIELAQGPAILRGLDLTLARGETLALMGRNGAGKSTLLRAAAGLLEPTRGRIESGGRVALLLQNPGDYFLHERVEQELSAPALRAAGLDRLAHRNPRDLSGGERQRLAMAIVSGGEPPAVIALDEPTRGMDRAAKAALAGELRRRAQEGQAVIVATHDPEFAAACAERALLLADGRVIADGPATELLAGGWYFATETARILGGAGGALLPEHGARLLRDRSALEAAL